MTCAALVIALALSASPPAVVEKEGVRIATELFSHIYSWEVTNLGTTPITGFQVEYSGCYNHKAPEGWATEVESGVFRAWAGDAGPSIPPGGAATFTARTTSGGNALGLVRAEVTVGESPPRTVVFGEVWGPVGKPRGLVALVAVLLSAVVVAHTVILVRRSRPEPAARRP